jgi:ring-1,2-phenylacetyl-CoA epoxidase subunit PaaD
MIPMSRSDAVASISEFPLAENIRAAVYAVNDPELAGVSIGDLGLVRSISITDDGCAQIVLVPTFLGCPALTLIASDVERAAVRAGATHATAGFDHSAPWTAASITEQGRVALKQLGISVANEAGCACPYCGSLALNRVSPVGPAACRSVHWCTSCRNIVEVFRDSSPVSLSMPVRRNSAAIQEVDTYVYL